MTDDIDTQRAAVARAFNRSMDPLADIATQFETIDVDPFSIFVGNVLETQNLSDKTINDYTTIFAEWKAFMTEQGRHPACPSEDHVLAYIDHCLAGGNAPVTVRGKIRRLNRTYEYWQDDSVFPHPTTYDPFSVALDRASFPDRDEKDYPRISLEELRSKVQNVRHHRDRALVVLQLKLGLRAGEVMNIQLEDINLEEPELHRHYPEIGEHEMVQDRPNSVYIPPSVYSDAPVPGREGNKSKRPRVLPLDGETRRVLLRYLLVRPNVDDTTILLSKTRYKPLAQNEPAKIWEDAFPEYGESGRHRAIRSHWGRHYFTTHFTVREEVSPELVCYMRGDRNGASVENDGAIRHYVHTYYEDIETLYRERIFRLKV